MNQRLRSAATWRAAGVYTGERRAGEPWRWRRGVYHSGTEVGEFAGKHFGKSGRQILLVGGAGFDPRTLTVPRLLAGVTDGRLDGVFLREQRPSAGPELLYRAEEQLIQLRKIVHRAEIVEIPVFEEAGTVWHAGIGRHSVAAVQRLGLESYDDIVVDFSALSIGSSFPITRLLLERLEAMAVTGTEGGGGASRTVNLHAFVTASPETDDSIVPQPSDVVGPVHGFQGRFGIDATADAARLWMPQLRVGKEGVLERLFDYVKPHDVVPVLPFPAHDPRYGDRLIEHYAAKLEGRRQEIEDPRQWNVDARSIVYADEGNPLDFYRTVLRIHDGRQPVFESTGGSLLLLSPVGSKVLALGAMMAAIERGLPVVYVEALSYSFKAPLDSQSEPQYTVGDLVHVWLHGEAYPPVRRRDASGGRQAVEPAHEPDGTVS